MAFLPVKEAHEKITEGVKPSMLPPDNNAFSLVTANTGVKNSESWQAIMDTSKDIKEVCDRIRFVETKDLPFKDEAIKACALFMNKTLSIISLGGKCVAVWDRLDEEEKPVFDFATVSAMSTFYANRSFDFKFVKDDVVKRKDFNIFDEWIKAFDSNRFEGVTFAPLCKYNKTHLNLFRGWQVEPDASGIDKCKLMLWHIENVICSSNKINYNYFIGWLAHMIQKPWEKPGVAVVLRSEGRGTGKSTVDDVFLKKVLGRASLTTNKSSHILGNFNSHMADKILMVLEEAVFAGNPEAGAILNDLITRDRTSIERKHMDIIEVKSCMRIMTMTNSEWAVPVVKDERRYFVLDVSEIKKQDRKYFGALRDDMKNGGVEQLLAYLQNYDISDFDVRAVPFTDALKGQVSLSLSTENKFILDVLTDGVVGDYNVFDGGVPTQDIYTEYQNYQSKTGYGKCITKSEFTKEIKKALPGCVKSGQKIYRVSLKGVKENVRACGYVFKSADECRAKFIKTQNLNDNIFDIFNN